MFGRSRLALVAIVSVVVAGVALYYISLPKDCPKAICDEVARITEKHGVEKPDWAALAKDWAAVVTKIDDGKITTPCAECLILAKRNRAIAQEKAGGERGEELKIDLPQQPPETRVKISFEELRDRYKEGRKIRSTSIFRVRGKAAAKDWGIAHKQFVDALYEVQAQIVIEKNDGTDVLATFWLPRVQKTVVFSDEEFERDWPDAPALNAAWALAEKSLPYLAAFRDVGNIADFVDPKQQRLLGLIVPRLKGKGQGPLTVIQDPEIFSGCKFRYGYRRDWGPTGIELLEGGVLDRKTLIELANRMTLFMDYNVFPAQAKMSGDKWGAKSAELGFLVAPLGYKTEGEFEIQLEKTDGKTADLKIDKGNIVLIGQRPERAERHEFSVKSGTARFALDRYMVRDAQMTFEYQGELASLGHLFFPMQADAKFEIDSMYRAE